MLIRLFSHLFRDPYVDALIRKLHTLTDERNQLIERVSFLESEIRNRESSTRWMRREWRASKAREAARAERERDAEAAMGRIGRAVL